MILSRLRTSASIVITDSSRPANRQRFVQANLNILGVLHYFKFCFELSPVPLLSAGLHEFVQLEFYEVGFLAQCGRIR